MLVRYFRRPSRIAQLRSSTGGHLLEVELVRQALNHNNSSEKHATVQLRKRFYGTLCGTPAKRQLGK